MFRLEWLLWNVYFRAHLLVIPASESVLSGSLCCLGPGLLVLLQPLSLLPSLLQLPLQGQHLVILGHSLLQALACFLLFKPASHNRHNPSKLCFSLRSQCKSVCFFVYVFLVGSFSFFIGQFVSEVWQERVGEGGEDMEQKAQFGFEPRPLG